MNEYIIYPEEKKGEETLINALLSIYKTDMPVVICIGTDRAVGDSLGPLVGTKLTNILRGKAYVYGNMLNPITAKESETVYKTIRFLHPISKILVVDAGVGDESELGLIKVLNGGIKPGLALNKNLSVFGDVSIVGITAPRENASEYLIYKTDIGEVYKMSSIIAASIASVIIKNKT